MRPFHLIIFLICLCISCNKTPHNSNNIEGESIPLKHAKGFTIAEADSFTIITVNNPWKKGEIYDRYYLVKDLSVETPDNGNKIKIPLQSLMINSATYIGFLELLGELDKVKGVCNANYIYNKDILDGVSEGTIKNLGDSFNLDIENLLLLNPQAVMTTAYNADDANSKRIKQSNLNTLYNIEWQEPTILGRAEWIKFIAAFFDKQALGDSIYNEIELKYNAAKEIANEETNRPTIFSGQDYRGTWSFAGGNSFTAQLFRDANASYLYENDTTATSIPANIEQSLINFSETDIWIGTQENSLEAMAQLNSKYKLFKAYKNGNVYNINKRMNENGGNDYWESAIARPDLLLKDMIKICHPHLLQDYELTYMDKLTTNEK